MYVSSLTKNKPSVIYCVKFKSYVLGKTDWYKQLPSRHKSKSSNKRSKT